MNPEAPVLPVSALVVCLCAAWCGVCRDYQSRFVDVQAKYPQVEFRWIDVEDEADLLHPLDIEDFPTLLLAVGNEARFLGPVTPHAEMLERLIRSQIQDPAAPTLVNQSISDLVLRIRGKSST
jgi:thioredoxin 1